MSVDLAVCGRCLTADDHRWLRSTLVVATVCGRCEGQAIWVLDGRISLPRLAYRGVASEFSTSSSMVRYNLVVWDVNGYYRELGVPHNASRAEIRRAYQAAMGSAGADMVRLTYIVKQLLDEDVRATYDRCRPGEIYFDEYVRQMVLRRAREAASSAIAQGEVDPGESIETFMDSIGRVVEVLDKPTREGDTERSLAQGWGYYLWQSSKVDHETLARWRNLLCDAAQGQALRMGIGFCRGESPVAVRQVDDELVAFIHEDAPPTPSLATAAIEAINNNQTV